MDEYKAKKWVKDKSNQKMVMDKFLKDYPPTHAKIALFMAGIPGAGKTEFAENTIREATPAFLPIEHDKLVEYIDTYRPENYYNYRKAGSTLVTKLFDVALEHEYAFIFDGTLSHDNSINNINKAIRAGYVVYVLYIVKDARLAWELTRARELNTRRGIEKAGFIDTCNKINLNLRAIFKTHKEHKSFNFWIINKRGVHGIENATAIFHGPGLDKSVAIEKELRKSYNTKELK